jgi:hypothetical protein
MTQILDIFLIITISKACGVTTLQISKRECMFHKVFSYTNSFFSCFITALIVTESA